MNAFDTDTIAAIATGLTESGIGIIRISGPESYAVAERVFMTKSGKYPDFSQSHRVHYGFIYRSKKDAETGTVSRETLDEVLLLNMKGPRSYTGEDTVEIDCHGGVLMMQRILETVIAAGARHAEPGEFTKRAFLNGRIDLSQAEAVIDVINAKNDRALRASVLQLSGKLSEEIKALRAQILEDTAFIEAALDDPEHISVDGFSERLMADMKTSGKRLKKLIASADEGKRIKEGINTVIVGKPNAGKSSLLNALMREERAIVTEIAGTTRDTLQESINLRGLTLNLMDTAGIRETEDTVERIGVMRARKAAEEADLLIYVVDGSVPLDASDEEIIAFANAHQKTTLIILNKQDLEQQIFEEALRARIPGAEVCAVSAKKQIGIEQLESRIEQLFACGAVQMNDELLITSARQKRALEEAHQSVQNVMQSIEVGMPEDFYSIDLMNAYESLGAVLGEAVGEDLVNEIFGKFCMGK